MLTASRFPFCIPMTSAIAAKKSDDAAEYAEPYTPRSAVDAGGDTMPENESSEDVTLSTVPCTESSAPSLISEGAEDSVQGTVLSVTSSLDSFSGIVSPPASTALLGVYGSAYSAASSLFFAAIALVMGIQNGKRDAVSTAPSTETAAS